MCRVLGHQSTCATIFLSISISSTIFTTVWLVLCQILRGMLVTLIGKNLIIIAYLEILSVVTEVLYTFTAIVHYWQTPLKRARLSQICQNIVFCTDRIYEMKISTIVLRYALKEKKTILFGNFSQRSDPPPPLLGTPFPKKNFSVYFAF